MGMHRKRKWAAAGLTAMSAGLWAATFATQGGRVTRDDVSDLRGAAVCATVATVVLLALWVMVAPLCKRLEGLEAWRDAQDGAWGDYHDGEAAALGDGQSPAVLRPVDGRRVSRPVA